MSKNRKLFYFLPVCILTLVVFWPSFFHLFRAETYLYFLNTQNSSPLSLIFHWYNYEAKSLYSPGDSWLFRPLLYMILGIEKAAFGVDYRLWYFVAFLANVASSFALFRLLWSLRPGLFATVAASFFAVSYMAINSKLYLQIMPYAIFITLALTSLYYVLRKRPLASLAFIFVASFFYEMGFLFLCTLLSYYLFIRPKNKAILFYGLSIAAYLAVYIFTHRSANLVAGNPFPSLASGNGIVTIINTWLSQVFVPSIYDLLPVKALQLQPAGFAVTYPIPLIGLNAIVLIILIYVAFRTHNEESEEYSYLYLVAGLLTIYLLAITLSRVGKFGPAYILDTNYDANLFLALAIIVTYTYFRNRSLPKHLKTYALIAALFFVVVSSYKSFTLNYDLWQMEARGRSVLTQIDTFVKEHKDEPDFSFQVVLDEQTEADWTIETWTLDDGNVVFHHYLVPQILYLQY